MDLFEKQISWNKSKTTSNTTVIIFVKRASRTAFDYINVFSAYFSVPSMIIYQFHEKNNQN